MRSFTSFADDLNGAVSDLAGGFAGVVKAQQTWDKIRGKDKGKVGSTNPYPKDDPKHYAPETVGFQMPSMGGNMTQVAVLGGMGLIALVIVARSVR